MGRRAGPRQIDESPADTDEPRLARTDEPRRAEIDVARVLGEYKRLVLLGKARLPFAEARSIVGPDCAYHLYFRHAPEPAAKSGRRRTQAGRALRRRSRVRRPKRRPSR